MKRWFVLIAVLMAGMGTRTANAKAPHPILGGSLKSWVAAWGKYAAGGDGVYNWSKCPAPSSVDRYLVTIVSNGTIAIVGQTCPSSAKPSNAANIVAAAVFFPKDYKPRGKVKTDQGTDLLYYSASLAKLNVAKAWGQDCNQRPVNPGLFTLSPDSDGGGDWQLAIGTCA